MKRAPKASIKRKVFEVPGPKADSEVVPLDVRARQVRPQVCATPSKPLLVSFRDELVIPVLEVACTSWADAAPQQTLP